MSSQFPWYPGTDGKCPPDKYDFVSTFLHELLHCVGFMGSVHPEESLTALTPMVPLPIPAFPALHIAPYRIPPPLLAPPVFRPSPYPCHIPPPPLPT